jgi:hypothetical protein
MQLATFAVLNASLPGCLLVLLLVFSWRGSEIQYLGA